MVVANNALGSDWEKFRIGLNGIDNNNNNNRINNNNKAKISVLAMVHFKQHTVLVLMI